MDMEYKGYVIRPHLNNPRSLIIVQNGKAGKIPVMLQGLFTDRGLARQMIDLYTEGK